MTESHDLSCSGSRSAFGLQSPVCRQETQRFVVVGGGGGGEGGGGVDGGVDGGIDGGVDSFVGSVSRGRSIGSIGCAWSGGTTCSVVSSSSSNREGSMSENSG